MTRYTHDLPRRRKTSLRPGLLFFLLAMAAPAAHAQNFLERLNKGLGQVNQALSGNHPSRQNAGPNAPQPSEQQIRQMATALTAPGKPDTVQPLYAESRDLIAEILLISSCNFQTPGAQLNRFKAPGATLSFVTTTINMRYHPQSECLDVQRVDGWTAKARNAFRFRAQFVSAQSGESGERYYELVKQPDGVWLLGHAAMW